MPLAQYGQTSPAGLDPWPIESTLAPLATAGSSANAQLMLSDYQYQRDAANNLYGQDMAAQHEFAKKQLQQQLYEQNLKAVQEGAKTPGLLDIYASSPQFQGVVGGVDPGVLHATSTNLRDMQRAEQFQKGAAGLQSSTTAGFQPNADQAAIASGGLAGPQGTPIPIQVANLKLQGDLARASASGGERAPGITYSGKPDESGGQINITGGGKTNLKTPEAVREYAIAHGLAPPVVQPPGATPPAPKTGRVPNLPMAKTDTPPSASAQGGVQVLPNNTANVKKVADGIRASINTGGGALTPGQVAAVKRGMAMNGGQVRIGIAPGGTWHVLDDKGNIVQ